MKEKKPIEGKLGELDHLGSQLEDLEVLVEMAEEEPDESLTEEAAGSCKEISDALEALKLRKSRAKQVWLFPPEQMLSTASQKQTTNTIWQLIRIMQMKLIHFRFATKQPNCMI